MQYYLAFMKYAYRNVMCPCNIFSSLVLYSYYDYVMAIMVVQIEDTIDWLTDKPLRCAVCGSEHIKHWGSTSRKINDIKPVNTVVYRFYCNQCHSTFRYYPMGVDQSRYSARIRRLAALIWLMDLSVRDVVDVFEELGVKLNRMTVWREGQKLVNELNSLKLLNPSLRYSIDRSGGIENRLNGNVLLVLSLLNGKKAVLGSLNIHDPDLVISWLKPILKGMNLRITTMGTREFLDTCFLDIPSPYSYMPYETIDFDRRRD